MMGPGGRGFVGLLGSVTRQRSPGAASCRVAGGTCRSVDLTELAHQLAKPSSPGSTVRIRPSAEGRAKPPLRDQQRKRCQSERSRFQLDGIIELTRRLTSSLRTPAGQGILIKTSPLIATSVPAPPSSVSVPAPPSSVSLPAPPDSELSRAL